MEALFLRMALLHYHLTQQLMDTNYSFTFQNSVFTEYTENAIICFYTNYVTIKNSTISHNFQGIHVYLVKEVLIEDSMISQAHNYGLYTSTVPIKCDDCQFGHN